MKTDSRGYKSYNGYSAFVGEVRAERCFLRKKRVFFPGSEEQKLKNAGYESESDRTVRENRVKEGGTFSYSKNHAKNISRAAKVPLSPAIVETA